MKRMVKGAAVLALVLLPALASAQAGIRNSKHDLSNSNSTAGVVKNANATANQICIYCHTPHKAQSTQLLWNHTATATASWTWGNDLNGTPMTATTEGTPLPTALRSGSKRCLGCHDGTVALGDVSNSGSGVTGVIAGLASIAGKTDATGMLIAASGNQVGAGGNMGGNHPVSIPYAGETYATVVSGVPASSIGVVGGYYAVTTTGCTSPSGVCTTAPATDGRSGVAINLIPTTAGGTTNVGVECSTCHEPHNRYNFAFFARVDVANASGLCQSCHNK